jgi:hypothetical protein
MVYRGHVENGVIRLDRSASLPEGSEVCVQIVPPLAGYQTETTLEQEVAAIWADVPESEWNRLPDDLTHDIDHHIYGTPQ